MVGQWALDPFIGVRIPVPQPNFSKKAISAENKYMKHVYILRHAQKDNSGKLTNEGIESAKLMRKKIPKFNIVIASDSPRTQETAALLTGLQPQLDIRAGYFNAPQQIGKEIDREALTNLFGFTGAYLANKEIEKNVTTQANALIALIYETLNKLSLNENALIVSHDITLIPAIRILDKKLTIQSFKYLSGFIINEDKMIQLFAQ